MIVDERSAAFFALGAAQASGAPVALLCTSGTAAANYHPAVCEADESAMPLIVLTADRPPELRGIGAGQTIDQIKLYGSSVRWFCEVGTHEADDDGLLHYRSTACRALRRRARRAAARARSTSTCPGASRWRRSPVEGAVTATDPLALEGRDGRPLTAVDADRPRAARPFLLDEVAGHIGDAISGVIVAGRQLDPELREPLAHLAAAAGFPILAEPTSQLRCGPHDRSHVVAAYDLLLRDERFARRVAPDLVLRFGEMPTSKPLRAWLAASRRRPDRRRPLRRLERADPPGGGDPARRPDRAGRRAGRRGSSEGPRAAPDALARGRARPRGARSRPSWPALGELTEPGLHRAARRAPTATATSSTPPRACRSATRRRSCRRPTPTRSSSATAAPTGSTASSPPASAPPTPAAGRRRSSPATSASSTTSAASPPCATSPTPVRIVVIDNDGGGIFHFLPQEEALDGEEFEALLGTPRGVDAAKAAALFDLPHRRSSRSPSCPTPSPPAPA